MLAQSLAQAMEGVRVAYAFSRPTPAIQSLAVALDTGMRRCYSLLTS